MGDAKYLGDIEELVLLAVARLGENAYGVSIRQTVEEVRPISIGAVYTTLERLEEKGFVSARQGEATPERGGRAKRYYRMEGAGSQALADAERMRALLRTRGGLQPSGGAA